MDKTVRKFSCLMKYNINCVVYTNYSSNNLLLKCHVTMHSHTKTDFIQQNLDKKRITRFAK